VSRPAHPRRKRAAAALALPALVAALVAVGCGVDADDAPRAIPAEDLQASQAEDATSTTASDTRDAPIGPPQEVRVYFARSVDDQQRLQTAFRAVSSPATEGGVLDALLLEPPTPEERDEGLVTAIPTTTRQVRPPEWQDGGVLLVSLNSGLFDVEGETLKLAFAQIVCSVTSLGNVQDVIFEVGGVTVPAVDGEGKQVNGPVTCDAYSALRAGG
jgi:spore germination protein GerM